MRAILVGLMVVGCAPALGTPGLDARGDVRCFDGDAQTTAVAVCDSVAEVRVGGGCSVPRASDIDCVTGPHCTRHPDRCAAPFCVDHVPDITRCAEWADQCAAMGRTECFVDFDGNVVP